MDKLTLTRQFGIQFDIFLGSSNCLVDTNHENAYFFSNFSLRSIFRWGFPGKNRRIFLRFLIKDIQSVRIEVKEGIYARRVLYMDIRGRGAIPLTRTDENLTPREMEQKAAELAYFLHVPFILADLSIGIFLWIAVSSLAPVGLLMSRYGSNNKYSFLGGLRAAAQSISYEIPLTLCVLSISLRAIRMRRHPFSRSYGAILLLSIVMVFSTNLSIQQINSSSIYQYVWSWTVDNDFSFEFGYLIDPLTSIMLLLITTVGIMVLIYSDNYMAHDQGYLRFFAYMSFFSTSMLGLVTSSNLIQIYIFWELVGMCSYLLIGSFS
ncbi:hypothetical protein CASFOL_007891 [Castilleja foliolosa]|uniref:Photosystem I assembly protein Ycf4 n=1 Tax=Castilleja foliolosa TaxID=1961234 RepID=A0ABD3E368_9LAMI